MIILFKSYSFAIRNRPFFVQKNYFYCSNKNNITLSRKTRMKGIVIAAAVAVGLYLIIEANNATAADDPTDAMQPDASEFSNPQFAQTQHFEGFSAQPYKDGSSGSTQLYSVGYGHQIQPGESYLMNGVTEPQAAQLLANDLQTIVDAINNTGVSFTQGQLDAATDLGMSGIGASLALVSIYNDQGAAGVAQWLPTAYITWHPVPGGPGQTNSSLVSRRQSELATWNAGSATT